MGLSKVKLLIFIDWYVPAFKAGGPVSSIQNLVKLLNKEYEIFIFTSAYDLNSTVAHSNIPLNQWVEDHYMEKVYYNTQPLTHSKINNIIEVTQCKHIYFNSLFSINYFIKPLIFLPKAKKLGVFLSPRGMLHPKAFSQKKCKKIIFISILKLLPIFKRIKIIASTLEEAQYIKQKGFKNDLVVVNNVPELSYFDLSIEFKQRSFITISRIAEEKNSIGTLLSFSKLKHPAQLVWIGDAPQNNYAKRFWNVVNSLPKHLSFKHLGALGKQDIKKHLQESAFFILPTFGENFGHAIFEALSAGKPAIIGSNTPFTDLEGNKAGFLVDPTDYNQIADKMYCLISLGEQTYYTMAENARNYAKSTINISDLKKKYIALWQ